MSEPSAPEVTEKVEVENTEVDLNTSDSNDTKDKALNDDLFFSTISDPTTNDESEEKSKQKEDMDELFRINSPPTSNNNIKEIKLTDDEEDDPFDPKNESKPAKAPVEAPAAANISVKPALTTQDSIRSGNSGKSEVKHTSFDDIMMEDDEDKDKFIEISLSDPTKVGDGMGSYMVYKLTTKTNFPAFKSAEFSTQRRFSDFLSLFEKLKEKHLPAGRILPPMPEKDMISMAKVKMSKDDQSQPIDFIAKRRAALERFLNRLGKHKTFRFDPDFRDFVEITDELPKATNTSTLSGAGMVKMFKNLTDSVSKISIKMEETDSWFEEKTRQVDGLHQQFSKLHSTIEILYNWRKNLSFATNDFSKSIAILANSEEQLNLSRALSQLGEIYEKIDLIFAEQANSDYFMFGELAKDYVGLFDNIKEVFHQRIKVYSNWKKAEDTLRLKKENKTKLENANKQDKIPAAAAEIRDWELRVEKYDQEFEQISKTIKEEVKRFNLSRIKEIETKIVKYLESLLNSQEQIAGIWEQYLPQVKAI